MKILNAVSFLLAAGLLLTALSGCDLSGRVEADVSISKIQEQSQSQSRSQTSAQTAPKTATQGQTDPQTPSESQTLPAPTTDIETTVKTEEPPETTTQPGVTTEPTIVDTTPPKVTGKDFSVTQGESVSYKKQITVTDDYDPNPTIEVDNSAVDLDTPGVYPVIYTVTDSAGNSTTLTLMLTVKEKAPPKEATEEYVLYLAREILDEITDDSMSDLQVAYTIYRWSKRNIGYVSTSDKSSWIVGAYDALTKKKGDCFSYFAASKALLTAAGIENVDVYRAPNSVRKSSHYWSLVNVGDGWYHFDSTPFVFDNSNFFMLTDDEIHAWDKKYYKGEHDYDPEGLPKVATESIQYMVNYSSSKLKEP